MTTNEQMIKITQTYELMRDLNRICAGYSKSARKLNDKLYDELFGQLSDGNFPSYFRQCIIDSLERLAEEGQEIAWGIQTKSEEVK